MATEFETEIDDSLYSRQRYVLGDGAMQRMAKSSVLLYGAGGLGIEIAKNIVLAGIKSFTIQDPQKAIVADLGTQFFLTEEDVAKDIYRAETSAVKLAELNPYVSIQMLTTVLDDSTDLKYLQQYQCVILTEVSLSVQLKVNSFCRAHDIKFVSADVFGLFCGAFCDFGDQFEVSDPNGEEPKETFIASITKANPGVVTCLDNRMHGFESGDMVSFREVAGMTKLNGQQIKIEVLSPYAFSICDTSADSFSPYEAGGIATQVKIPKVLSFESLEQQLKKPSTLIADYSKFDLPPSVHVGFLALHRFREDLRRLPNCWCQTDAALLIGFVKDLINNKSVDVEASDISEDTIKLLSFTCQGSFAPLCATLGGFVAQEALKAITGKFTPLSQWLYLDAVDVLCEEDRQNQALFHPRDDRYDLLRICVGETCIQKLADSKLFMVGCGAIGCEMLKNYALLGVGTSEKGQITITDNDLIEKSNLNRQFLFRPQHIRQPKSTTAAKSAVQINAAMKIIPQQHKVCPQTESTVYPDRFFEAQDLVVNALDNVEARRYVDSRCVTAQRSLLESGTMGTKGHTQVIVAHLTESYTSQRDPPDEEVPYCTLKSFPASIEHCIQWARDKFESSFAQKPNLFNKFWSSHGNVTEVTQKLENSSPLEGAVQVSKLVESRPTTWEDCIVIGRLKFEKYFNHKAKHLLHAFPLDTRISDGSLFWQSPKRPPVPVAFDPSKDLHLNFIIGTAHLYADVCGVPLPNPIDIDKIQQVLQTVKVPHFTPSNKKIITDESETKSAEENTVETDDLVEAADRIKAHSDSNKLGKMVPAEFEKDDDSNGHIDFITAAANLRAMMYQIECADRLKIKRIAGKIVPAIATTTAAVAGLVTIELIKVVQKLPIEKYRNCFLNLALPVMLLSEPGPAERTVIREGLSYTNWDRWDVYGNKDYTLQQFLTYFKDKYGFEATMVGQGVKMIYVPFMPGHSKRLPQTMLKLLKPSAGVTYSDLVVSFESMDQDDIPGPPVRYHFGL